MDKLHEPRDITSFTVWKTFLVQMQDPSDIFCLETNRAQTRVYLESFLHFSTKTYSVTPH